MDVFLGVMIPFIGTSLGAACVYLMRSEINQSLQNILNGFAGGVMIAASVWSLLIPSIEQSRSYYSLPFIPAAIGFMAGVMFLIALERLYPLFNKSEKGESKSLKDTSKLLLAVTIHNVPEGLAVGVVFAGVLTQNSNINFMGALALSLGIAIQNFPEGAIISLPLFCHGMKKSKSLLYGILSGVVEPIAAGLTLLLASVIIPILPYLLSFAAGAMVYVVVEELIPEMNENKQSNIGVISFSLGFVLMMILDVALG